MKLLHVDSSILGAGSVSRTLSAEIVADQQRRHPGLSVTTRDLGVDPIGHLSGAHLAAFQGTAPETEVLGRDVALGQAALEEFLAADIVVVGAPMYNFSIPSQLKAWIDRILIAGRTFRYTATGPEGLAKGKRVIVAVSRGGYYGPGAPSEAAEHLEKYLRTVFGLIGITDVEFIVAEGLAVGPDHREKGIATALQAASALAASA